ncbi:MAG TPA: hypothetical protein PLT66_06945 [Bacillota bacterium]|nr:hypothetical protein [Bacillota bacterium]
MSKRSFYIAAVLLLIMLYGCSSSGRNVLTGSRADYTLLLPEGWSECDALNPSADASAQNAAERTYMIVLCEDAEDFCENMTAQEFSELSEKSMLSRYAQAVISRTENGGYCCRCEVESVNVVFYVETFKCSDSFVQLVFWSSKSDYDDAYGQFVAIARSLTSK